MHTTDHPSTEIRPESAVVSTEPAQPKRVLHRLRRVRERQRISIRTVARRLGVNVTDLKAQEVETADMPLSVLQQWADALHVPITEIVAEPPNELSLPLLKRGKLLRIMKTVRAIHELTNQMPVKRMAQTLVDQIRELMPELNDVAAWNSTGYRRRRRDLGRAADHVIPERLQREDREAM